jgi:hypothetical protein
VCIEKSRQCCGDPGVICCPPDHPFPAGPSYCCTEPAVVDPGNPLISDCVPFAGS